jgi:hypothetical protein
MEFEGDGGEAGAGELVDVVGVLLETFEPAVLLPGSVVVVLVVEVVAGVGPATVKVVAHGAPAPQLLPLSAAAVTSCDPPGAAADTVAWNEVVADEPVVPGAASGDTAQVSCLVFVSSVRSRLARSAGQVAIAA